MSKQIELTIDIEIRRVTCPGVWLCQDGSVSLILHALNSTYQTHLVPPVFPMIFKTSFQFRKKFPMSCAVRNLGCVLKDEDLYCELIQFTSHCSTTEGVILAQYLGALTDILFVPEVCSSQGIDLLMRRTNDYPGILAPKIEIATRVRLEEVSLSGFSIVSSPTKKCKCSPGNDSKSHKPVCHTPQYHRLKSSPKKTCKSRSQSCGSPRSPCEKKDVPISQILSSQKHDRPAVQGDRSSCGRSAVFSMDIYVQNPWTMSAMACNNDCSVDTNPHNSSSVRSCCNKTDVFNVDTNARGPRRLLAPKTSKAEPTADSNSRVVHHRKPIHNHNAEEVLRNLTMLSETCEPLQDERYLVFNSVINSRNGCKRNAVFNVESEMLDPWQSLDRDGYSVDGDRESFRCRSQPHRPMHVSDTDDNYSDIAEERFRSLLESRYIDKEHAPIRRLSMCRTPRIYSVNPCTCYICRRYHEMFVPDYNEIV